MSTEIDSLKEAIEPGSVLKIGINGTYEDVWEKELKDMWDGTNMYEVSGAMRRTAQLRENILKRGSLNSKGNKGTVKNIPMRNR